MMESEMMQTLNELSPVVLEQYMASRLFQVVILSIFTVVFLVAAVGLLLLGRKYTRAREQYGGSDKDVGCYIFSGLSCFIALVLLGVALTAIVQYHYPLYYCLSGLLNK